MKTITALFLASFAFASSLGAAHAEDITPDDTATQVWAHTKTRAEVRAEMFAAREDGTLMAAASEGGSASYATLLPRSPLAAALRRELRAAGTDDLAHAVIGEDSGSFWLSKTASARMAAQPMVAVARSGAR